MSEFIHHFLDAEAKVSKKQNDCVRMLAERVSKRKQLMRRMIEVANERINEHGIKIGSEIKIQVLEGVEMSPV